MAPPYPQRIFEDPKRRPETVDSVKVYESACAQLCLTLGNSMDCRVHGSSFHGIFPGKNTGVGCHFLLQGKLLNPGIKPVPLASPALAGKFFTTSPI